MPSYWYKARDKFGAVVNGVIGAESRDSVALKLARMDYVPISIKETKENDGLNKFFDNFKRVGFSDLNMFTRQFAVLQKAGLPVILSLNTLKEQAINKTLKDVIGQMSRDIEAGASLSSAIEKHYGVFDVLYVNMIASGEVSGRLDEALERLAVLGEHEENIRMRIKSATRYPIIVVVAIVIAFLILTAVVVPRFASIFSQFSTELPLPTRIMVGINILVTKFWWLVFLIFGFFGFVFNKWVNTRKGRFLWDTFKLRVPIFGPLVLKLAMSRFARMTSTLMRSGVPMLKVLDLAAQGSGNALISKTIENIRNSVNEGKGMAEPMKASGMFAPPVIAMVSVGEDTGKLDELLLHVSNYYDSQVDYTTNNLTTLIEPILIFVLGCAVLFMALGIFLPMWNMMNVFRTQ